VAFSLDRLAVSGAPFLVVPGGASPSVGRDGSLALVRSSERPSQLVWVDRGGTIETILDLPGPAENSAQADVSSLDLSADGRRAVVNVSRDGAGELWVSDLARGSTSRLMAQPAVALTALWTPDERVVFTSLYGSRRWNLFRVAPGSSAPERLTDADAIQNPKAVSPDGRFLVFTEGAGRSADLWYMPLDGSGKAVPWQQTPANDGISASFSPDGRFLAYESDETGRSEIYVRPFPSGEGRYQVSTDGGQAPQWSAATHEILYRSRDRVMAATFSPRGAGLEIDKPRQLFVAEAGLMREFCPARDGRRLLMLRSRRNDRVTLVLNFPHELERLAAAGRKGQ
jgi:Tol biopolymer transport system component